MWPMSTWNEPNLTWIIRFEIHFVFLRPKCGLNRHGMSPTWHYIDIVLTLYWHYIDGRERHTPSMPLASIGQPVTRHTQSAAALSLSLSLSLSLACACIQLHRRLHRTLRRFFWASLALNLHILIAFLLILWDIAVWAHMIAFLHSLRDCRVIAAVAAIQEVVGGGPRDPT